MSKLLSLLSIQQVKKTNQKYRVQQQLINCDLNLSDLLLNEDLQLKVAYFGFAARVNSGGDRRKTLCETPNYIAPDVLAKKRHSFEVDVWSIGCILAF
ncbi:hypothetical protein V5799_002366 [Amblyomma americanum]|uniref:Protein kinase domain-containing protein n=1 Tax=Amblyomma americanum TaxID=6943 RepID=A0AAQ4CXJ6_AMBAM